jgi:ParB/RepB/Spo0J family partition protein
MPQKQRIEDIAKGRTNLFSLHWQKCEPAKLGTYPGKLNTRHDFGDLPEFALSLAEGIKEPVLGYMGDNGKFQITNGERRWRGAQWLEENKGIKILLPCMRESKGYSDTDRNVDLLRTNNGKPLEMIEKAEAMKRLSDAGMADKEIAQKAGCSITHVFDCLLLLNTAPEVQSAVRKGEMKGTLAVDLAREVPDPEKQTEILEKGREKATAQKKKPVAGVGDSGPASPMPATTKPKITAKHLPVATGKKAAAQKRARAPSGDSNDGMYWDESKNKFVKTPVKPITGTSFTEHKKSPKGLAAGGALTMLEELLDAVSRSDCDDKARYDTLEFLCEYAAGRKGLAIGTKFILGII